MAPSVKLADNGEYKLIVGAKLQADKIVEKMEDLSEIKKVEFQDNEYLNEDATDDALTDKGISYEKAGSYENAVLITDGNKNVATLKFKVIVVEDYEKHVSGIKDISVTTGSEVNYMDGVTKDEKIADIQVDSSKVDLNTAGEYTVTYIIVGDDKMTKITKTAKVIVSDPDVQKKLDMMEWKFTRHMDIC